MASSTPANARRPSEAIRRWCRESSQGVWTPCSDRRRARRNIPKTGPLIIAGNHPSYYDPIVLSLATTRHVRFFALADILKVPVIGWFGRQWGILPVYFKALANVRWYKVTPTKAYFIDNSVGFGHRDEIDLI